MVFRGREEEERCRRNSKVEHMGQNQCRKGPHKEPQIRNQSQPTTRSMKTLASRQVNGRTNPVAKTGS